MKVDLDLPDGVVKKLRAYNILIGGSDNIEALLIQMLDDTLTDKIVGTITAGTVVQAITLPRTATVHNAGIRTLRAGEPVYVDPTGISDGLGDAEPEPEEEKPAPRTRPAPPRQTVVQPTSALGDAELAADMEVADPEHEAKVDAPTWADQVGEGELEPSAEEAFARASGYEPPVHVPEPTLRRGRATIDRRRVQPFNGSEQSRI